MSSVKSRHPTTRIGLASIAGGLALAFLATGCGTVTGGSSEDSAKRADKVETLKITPELIKKAKKEGSLLVRNGTPADTMAGLGKAFQEQYGIEVEADRKVGVVGTDQFRQEEQSGKHVVDVMWNVDPPGAIDLQKDGYLQKFTIPN
ncbi:MAG: hypothetical protein ACRDT8_25565, partial [Micromonosporaceae bacterium]